MKVFTILFAFATGALALPSADNSPQVKHIVPCADLLIEYMIRENPPFHPPLAKLAIGGLTLREFLEIVVQAARDENVDLDDSPSSKAKWEKVGAKVAETIASRPEFRNVQGIPECILDFVKELSGCLTAENIGQCLLNALKKLLQCIIA